MPKATWDPDHDPDARVERDGTAVRQVLHFARPFTHDGAKSDVELAVTYLHLLADFFGIDPSSLPLAPGMPRPTMSQRLLRFLRSMPGLRWLEWLLPRGGVQLNPNPIIAEVRDHESVAVIFVQAVPVYVGWSTIYLPILGAGIRVMIATSPRRVTSVYSTLRYDAPRAVVARGPAPFPTTTGEAARFLDVDQDAVEGLFIYERPQSVKRQAELEDFGPLILVGRMSPPPNLPPKGRELPYRDFFDWDLNRVTRSEVMASDVTGLGFRVDRRSQSGRPEPGPYRPGAELDTYREDLPLRDLAGPNPMQELHGPRVYVAQDNPLGIDPPKKPGGADFDYTSRNDDFAAVSAYHHCDAAFRMVEALGFPLAQYFSENVKWHEFPVRVVHRAPIRPGPAVFDGRTVNAQVVRGEHPHVVGEIRFALGDLSDKIDNPIGIATDARFAWHEFGHVLLIAATGEPEFRFAHSAGDTLAAIICDLDSVAAAAKPAEPWRGVTFPWVEALRRHDRPVGTGWAWQGSLYDRTTYADMRDPAGYRAEQILSSTLFRLYRALGGDAWNGDLANRHARRAAAAYTVYLVVRAIQALGPATMVPALDAYALAGALMDADVATSYLLPNAKVFKPFKARLRRGGAVYKVVRWAFEQQGLYVGSTAWPVNDPGTPEPVDVYIEDGRHGGYEYAEDWDSTSPDVRVVPSPSPSAPDTPPHASHLSYVYVRVYNRGTQATPPAATVTVFATLLPGARPPHWRLAGPFNPWAQLTPDTGAVTTAVVTPGAFVDFGPFKWQPLLRGHYSLLACVDAPGDRCNALTPTLACAVGPTRLAHLIPFDNNTAHRRIHVT